MLNSMQVKKRTPFLKVKGCMNMMNKKNVLKMMALGMAAVAVFGMAGCGGSSAGSKSASSQTQKESPLMQKIKSSKDKAHNQKCTCTRANKTIIDTNAKSESHTNI